MDAIERHADGSVTINEPGVYEIRSGHARDSVWELELPFRKPPLSLNARYGHWSQPRKLEEEVRKAAWALAKRQRIPALEVITAELVWFPGTNRRYDADNIAPTLKAAIDGLVAAGVLPDDDSNRVLSTGQRIITRKQDPAGSSQARLLLIIAGIPA